MPVWIYKISEHSVTLAGDQVRVVATILRDGKEWAGREIVLSLADVQADTPEQLKARLDDHVSLIVKQEGQIETDLKAKFDAAFAVGVKVPEEKIDAVVIEGVK